MTCHDESDSHFAINRYGLQSLRFLDTAVAGSLVPSVSNRYPSLHNPRIQEHLVMAQTGIEADLASLRTRVS